MPVEDGQPSRVSRRVKLAFHGADTDTDTNILADILARIVARMSACRLACHRNNFRKSRLSDMSARILATIHVGVGVGVVECQLNAVHTYAERRYRCATRLMSRCIGARYR